MALVSAGATTVVSNTTLDTTNGSFTQLYSAAVGAELLVVFAAMLDNPDITAGGAHVGEVSTLTYGGNSLIRRVQSPLTSTILRAEIWTLTNPPSGANDLAGNLDAFTDAYTIHALTVSGGVNLSSPVGDTSSLEGTTAGWSVTIDSTVANSLLFAIGAGQGGDLSPFTPVSGTELLDGNTGTGTTTELSFWVAERLTTTLGAYALAATAAGADDWDMAAIEVKPAVIGAHLLGGKLLGGNLIEGFLTR